MNEAAITVWKTCLTNHGLSVTSSLPMCGATNQIPGASVMDMAQNTSSPSPSIGIVTQMLLFF